MLVKQILKEKPATQVATIAPDAPVSDAVAILSERRIGAVVVSDGGAVVGILSARDIVREIGKRGPGCLSDEVSEMMTGHPTTCTRDDAADRVLQIMTEGRFRHLPVVEDGAMIGLISIGDVVKARLSELSAESSALQEMIMGH